MDHDLAINLHRSFADFGGGICFGIALTLALVWAAVVRGPVTGLLSLFLGTVFGIAVISWAHTVSFADGREIAKTFAAVGGCAIAAIVTIEIVRRAPETAMLAIFSILAGVGATVALWLYAPHENLLLLVVIVGIVTFLACMGMLALSIDRRHAREIQNPRVVNYYEQPQDAPAFPREDRRWQLTGPRPKPTTNLPVRRDEKTGRWLT